MSPAHTKSVNIYDAKTHLSRLIAEVESGDEVTINRNGRPVARLVPYRPAHPVRKPGVWSGRIRISSDFDEFTDEDARDWYGE
jgi:prevent-host-death family protein